MCMINISPRVAFISSSHVYSYFCYNFSNLVCTFQFLNKLLQKYNVINIEFGINENKFDITISTKTVASAEIALQRFIGKHRVAC